MIVKATVTNSGGLATVWCLYPQEAGDIQVNPTYWNGQAVAAPTQRRADCRAVLESSGGGDATISGYPVVTVKRGTGTGEIDAEERQQVKLVDDKISAAKFATASARR